MKEKLKSYNFWASAISAAMVLLQALSLKIDVPHVAEITAAFLSALCVAGIIKKTPSDPSQKDDSEEARSADSSDGGRDEEENK